MAKRRGLGLLEIMASLLLAGTILTLVIHAAMLAAEQRTAARYETAALQEAANAIERCAAMPFDALTSEAVRAMALSQDAAETLPQGQLSVTVTEPGGEPATKRITAVVAWGGGECPRKVQLSTWRFNAEDKR